MSISYIPEQEDYKELTPFKRFVLQSFPWINENFDALTNYELMGKIIEYLNTVIDNENALETNMKNLYDAFTSLHDYVSNYFDNLDVQNEINEKLDSMVEDGTLTNLIGEYINYQIIPLINAQNEDIDDFKKDVNSSISTINSKVTSINSGAPAGVYATVSALETADPSHDKIYVVTSDGKWYYYNSADSSWTAGGTYQSSGIGDGTIGIENLDNDLNMQYLADSNLFNIDKKYKYFDSTKFGYGIYGNDATPQNRIALKPANFCEISQIPKLKIIPSGDYQIGLFICVNKSYSTTADNLVRDTGWITTETTIDFSDDTYENAVYFGIRIRKTDNTTIDMDIFQNLAFKFYVINSYNFNNVDVTNLSEILNVDTQELDSVENIVMTNTTTKNFKSQILNINHPVLVAHRGFSSIAPENTLPAYEEARKGRILGM